MLFQGLHAVGIFSMGGGAEVTSFSKPFISRAQGLRCLSRPYLLLTIPATASRDGGPRARGWEERGGGLRGDDRTTVRAIGREPIGEQTFA